MVTSPNPQRLQKVLAHWGIASRRQAEVMIKAGQVRVNGEIAHVGQLVDLKHDCVDVNGKQLRPENRPQCQYFLLHKPYGVVSTCYDPQGRTTILDLFPAPLRQTQGLHPVGRLDAESTGALLVTNDGALTFRLTHPRHQIPKTYLVWVAGHPKAKTLNHWRQGINLSGRRTLPAEVEVIDRQGKQTQLQIRLWEGRNRQIRRVAEALHHPVQQLHRIAIGSLELQNLSPGQWRPLTLQEIQIFGNLKPLPN
jgi:23S rRNA pseudouridine2605 synthase